MWDSFSFYYIDAHKYIDNNHGEPYKYWLNEERKFVSFAKRYPNKLAVHLFFV